MKKNIFLLLAFFALAGLSPSAQADVKATLLSEISAEQYPSAIKNSKGYTVLGFYRSGCSHCESFYPKVNKITKEYPAANFYKMNVSSALPLAKELGVLGVPTLFIFKDGKELSRLNGDVSDAEIRSALAVTNNQ